MNGLARGGGAEQPVRAPDAEMSPQLTAVHRAAAAFAARARAPATETAYRRDWGDFDRWCQGHRLDALTAPPHIVALYLTDRAARLKTSTLERRLSAIRVMRRRGGHPLDTTDPQLAEVWQGIQRTLGTAKTGKAPIGTDLLAALLDGLGRDLAGSRDRALLALAFAGALRRSELVGLDVGDLAFSGEGVVLRLRRSKSDPRGEGRLKAIPRGPDPARCPVALLKAWLVAARLGEGPLFRGIDRVGRLQPGRLYAGSVARIIQRTVYQAGRRAGLSHRTAEAEAKRFAGHSLRAGFATAAAAAGAELWAIKHQTGHRSGAAVGDYIRVGGLFQGARSTKVIG